MQQSIDRLLDRYGTSITLIIKKDGGIDFSTGKPIQTEQRTSTRGVFTRYDSNDIIPDIINIDDVKCIISGETGIKKGDSVESLGNLYEVRDVKKLIRDGLVLKTTLQLRTGGTN